MAPTAQPTLMSQDPHRGYLSLSPILSSPHDDDHPHPSRPSPLAGDHPPHLPPPKVVAPRFHSSEPLHSCQTQIELPSIPLTHLPSHPPAHPPTHQPTHPSFHPPSHPRTNSSIHPLIASSTYLSFVPSFSCFPSSHPSLCSFMHPPHPLHLFIYLVFEMMVFLIHLLIW